MKQYRNTHPELREKERIYARRTFLNQKQESNDENIFQSENIISVN
jgi:hypothetical protein